MDDISEDNEDNNDVDFKLEDDEQVSSNEEHDDVVEVKKEIDDILDDDDDKPLRPPKMAKLKKEEQENDDYESPLFNCSECGLSLKSAGRLAAHVKKKHSNRKKPGTSRSRRLRRRDQNLIEDTLQIVLEEKPNEPLEENFGDDVARKSLEVYGEEVDKVTPISSCAYCTETFESMFDLSEHMISEHANASSSNIVDALQTIKNENTFDSNYDLNQDEDMVKREGQVEGELITAKLEEMEVKWLAILKKVVYKVKDDPEKAKCTICNKQFWSEKYLKSVHMIVAHPDKDYSVQCDGCGKVFKNQHHLNDHRSRYHKSRQKNYPNKQNLRLRKKLNNYSYSKDGTKETDNLGGERHICHYCGYTTVSKYNMTLHVYGKHEKDLEQHKDKLMNCHVCDYSTFYKGNFRSHMMKHEQHKDKMKTCAYCDYKSAYAGNMKMHIFNVHESKLDQNKHKLGVCSYCNYTTPIKTNLITHIKHVHEGVPRPKIKRKKKFVPPPEKIHACTLCEYRTNLKGNLKGHIQGVHMGIKRIRKSKSAAAAAAAAAAGTA